MATDKMQSSIPQLPPFSLCTAFVAGEIVAATATSGTPDWIKVTPRGPAHTRDGRNFNFSPETLAACFDADGLDLPADLNHAIALKGARGETADAIGWAKEVQARPDGTYARMEWLDSGKATLAARTHRYVSPTFFPDAAGNAIRLHSISLVAAPALLMPALAAAGSASSISEHPETIQEALGFDAATDMAVCLAAITELRAAFVPVDLFADAVASLNAANATVASIKSENRKAKVAALIDGALRELKIVPAQRAQYEALCQTDTGLAQVATLFANTTPGLQPSGLDRRRPDTGTPDNAETLSIRAARYRDAQAAAGIALTHAEAVRFVHDNPNAGQ
ncbi:phage protease [Methylorubrum populi]